MEHHEQPASSTTVSSLSLPVMVPSRSWSRDDGTPALERQQRQRYVHEHLRVREQQQQQHSRSGAASSNDSNDSNDSSNSNSNSLPAAASPPAAPAASPPTLDERGNMVSTELAELATAAGQAATARLAKLQAQSKFASAHSTSTPTSTPTPSCALNSNSNAASLTWDDVIVEGMLGVGGFASVFLVTVPKLDEPRCSGVPMAPTQPQPQPQQQPQAPKQLRRRPPRGKAASTGNSPKRTTGTSPRGRNSNSPKGTRSPPPPPPPPPPPSFLSSPISWTHASSKRRTSLYQSTLSDTFSFDSKDNEHEHEHEHGSDDYETPLADGQTANDEKRWAVLKSQNCTSESPSSTSPAGLQEDHQRHQAQEDEDVSIYSQSSSSSFSEDEEHSNYYALKCLSRRTLTSKHQFTTGASDLITEAFLLTRLAPHENLIRLYGVMDDGTHNLQEAFFRPGGYFLVLEALNSTLHDVLKIWRPSSDGRSSSVRNLMANTSTSSGPSSDSVPSLSHRLTNIAMGIVNGMDYLHSNRILFRDLKPQNVGFDKSGNVRLFDLGLARELSVPASASASVSPPLLSGVAGSLRYMAPETMLHQFCTYSSDVFGFGIVLWELCSLHKPHQSLRTPAQFQQCVGREGLRPSSRVLPSLLIRTASKTPSPSELALMAPFVEDVRQSITLRSVVAACWQHDWRKRPTFKHLRLVLETWSHQEQLQQQLQQLQLSRPPPPPPSVPESPVIVFKTATPRGRTMQRRRSSSSSFSSASPQEKQQQQRPDGGSRKRLHSLRKSNSFNSKLRQGNNGSGTLHSNSNTSSRIAHTSSNLGSNANGIKSQLSTIVGNGTTLPPPPPPAMAMPSPDISSPAYKRRPRGSDFRNLSRRSSSSSSGGSWTPKL